MHYGNTEKEKKHSIFFFTGIKQSMLWRLDLKNLCFVVLANCFFTKKYIYQHFSIASSLDNGVLATCFGNHILSRSINLVFRIKWMIEKPSDRNQTASRFHMMTDINIYIREHKLTWTVSSSKSTFKTPGIKPAPIPWILCGPWIHPAHNDKVSPNINTWKKQPLQKERIIWGMSKYEKCCAKFWILISKECEPDSSVVPTTIGKSFKHRKTIYNS